MSTYIKLSWVDSYVNPILLMKNNIFMFYNWLFKNRNIYIFALLPHHIFNIFIGDYFRIRIFKSQIILRGVFYKYNDTEVESKSNIDK